MATNQTFMAEDQVMPSFFPSLTSRESRPLISREELVRLLTNDAMLKARTEDYRKRLEIDKKFADEIKRMMPGITISALMDGKGKELKNFLKPTYYLMADVDLHNIPDDKLQALMQKADADEHTAVRYKTVSGHGFRIFSSYQPIDDPDVSVLELFSIMIRKMICYYEELLDVKLDEKCIDITRTAGLAFDPTAYFCWNATPFLLEPKDYKALYFLKAKATQKMRESRKRKASPSRPAVSSSSAPVSINEAAPHILQLLKQWGYVFEKGRHNEYILHFAKLCVRYGIDEQDALQYACGEFGSEYDAIASVLKSCYKHTQLFGTWHFYRQGESYAANPTVRVIKQWLSTHYEFHKNSVTGFYEVRSKMIEQGKYLKWTKIDDDIENSIWAEMDEQGLRFNTKKLRTIIQSDFSVPYDPLEEYLRNLPQWDGKTDYIKLLSNRIKIVPNPTALHTQELFAYFFKKWLVAMVVAWVTLSVVSQTVMIFIGKGGIFKTTFFTFLLPPCLRQYFLNESTACYTDKDYMEGFASKALLCLDEFESVFGKNLSAFKSCVTKLVFSIRRPYDKYRSELPHRAALCGTSNSVQIISDDENHRYSPWIVESIESPQSHLIDYDHVYAQAVALGQEVMKREKEHQSGWVFWLDTNDQEIIQKHNKPFMIPNFAEEQILRYYRVPDRDTPEQFIKFRYTAEIMERIGSTNSLCKNISKHNIASILKRLGFHHAHKERGNGWWVIEMEGAEINSNAMFDPSAKEELGSE